MREVESALAPCLSEALSDMLVHSFQCNLEDYDDLVIDHFFNDTVTALNLSAGKPQRRQSCDAAAT